SNLKLTSTGDVHLLEVYPPQLPDLFHGQQLTVLGRYSGNGPSALKLTGQVGKDAREFVYELTFPKSTEEKDSKDFVEHLWARPPWRRNSLADGRCRWRTSPVRQTRPQESWQRTATTSKPSSSMRWKRPPARTIASPERVTSWTPTAGRRSCWRSGTTPRLRR